MRGGEIAILFSGGGDSTLAAVWALDHYQRVRLLTYDSFVHRFVNNSRIHADQLAEKYGGDRCTHEIIPIHDLHKRFQRDFARDYVHYCDGRAVGILCMGCKLAMHTRTILYCLEHGVSTAADGALRIQSDHPECMPDVLNVLRRCYDRYGIRFINPVYDTESKKEIGSRLEELGLTSGIRIGQSSRTDQPVCIAGPFFTMWKFSAPVDQNRMVAFVEDKRALIEEIVSERTVDNDIEIPESSEASAFFLSEDDVAPGADWKEWEFGYPWDVIISWMMYPLWLAIRLLMKITARLESR